MSKRRSTLFVFTATMLALLSLGGVALAATIQCSGGECWGTEEDDEMHGTSAHDEMYGLGGADNMVGVDGDDLMYGGEGDDVMLGSDIQGNDTMYGGPGNDYIQGEDDCDWPIITGPDDTIYGGPGNDDLRPRDGDARVYGGHGIDGISGYCKGQVKFYGGNDDDSINVGDHYYRGNTENPDAPDVTEAPDYVDCGPGKDTIYYDKGIDKLRHCEVKHPLVGIA
jgi:Ca2+-binding RTX toxin-like protein